jgi:hypothetical protein
MVRSRSMRIGRRRRCMYRWNRRRWENGSVNLNGKWVRLQSWHANRFWHSLERERERERSVTLSTFKSSTNVYLPFENYLWKTIEEENIVRGVITAPGRPAKPEFFELGPLNSTADFFEVFFSHPLVCFSTPYAALYAPGKKVR